MTFEKHLVMEAGCQEEPTMELEVWNFELLPMGFREPHGQPSTWLRPGLRVGVRDPEICPPRAGRPPSETPGGAAAPRPAAVPAPHTHRHVPAAPRGRREPQARGGAATASEPAPPPPRGLSPRPPLRGRRGPPGAGGAREESGAGRVPPSHGARAGRRGRPGPLGAPRSSPPRPRGPREAGQEGRKPWAGRRQKPKEGRERRLRGRRCPACPSSSAASPPPPPPPPRAPLTPHPAAAPPPSGAAAEDSGAATTHGPVTSGVARRTSRPARSCARSPPASREPRPPRARAPTLQRRAEAEGSVPAPAQWPAAPTHARRPPPSGRRGDSQPGSAAEPAPPRAPGRRRRRRARARAPVSSGSRGSPGAGAAPAGAATGRGAAALARRRRAESPLPLNSRAPLRTYFLKHFRNHDRGKDRAEGRRSTADEPSAQDVRGPCRLGGRPSTPAGLPSCTAPRFTAYRRSGGPRRRHSPRATDGERPREESDAPPQRGGRSPNPSLAPTPSLRGARRRQRELTAWRERPWPRSLTCIPTVSSPRCSDLESIFSAPSLLPSSTPDDFRNHFPLAQRLLGFSVPGGPLPHPPPRAPTRPHPPRRLRPIPDLSSSPALEFSEMAAAPAGLEGSICSNSAAQAAQGAGLRGAGTLPWETVLDDH
ncbi:basic proline-rich protein-like [Canis lupus dingo]|uniref:basic proline-rich protein-like n=1 Tax=Canis lupus dingo TaxID=286419 RepID=UPI000DC6B49D|nr:basic proline-rich protein-like [Canis lupus dingo]